MYSGASIPAGYGLIRYTPPYPRWAWGFEMNGNRKQRSCSLLQKSTGLSRDMGPSPSRRDLIRPGLAFFDNGLECFAFAIALDINDQFITRLEVP